MKLAQPARVLPLILILAAACSRGSAEPAAPAGGAVPSAGTRPKLVFFMNPNGAPCQMQDRILRDMTSELSAQVDVVYLKTTNPPDIAWFEAFGIRSLPMLVVTDAAGRELRRATPGIQSPEQVRALLGR